jgi:23S rRNA (uridine2552-2'-O)-methyltransferase
MTVTKKNKVVRAWVARHINDHYVKDAKRDNYRSRAAYKLLEINDTYPCLTNGAIVIDLGCAPGSWSQAVLRKLDHEVKLIGVDLLEVEPLHGLEFIQGDFTNQDTLDQILTCLNGNLVDLVLSDMAPNLSGVKTVDQAKSAYLAELVLDFCTNYLKKGGDCVLKLFQGIDFNQIVSDFRRQFVKVSIYKPKASRDSSSEVYLICRQNI